MVKAIGNGKTTIKAESIDGNKSVTCKLTINKKTISTRIEVDDVSKESDEMSSYSLFNLSKEFSEKTDLKKDTYGNYIPNEYWDSSLGGEGYVINDLWEEEYKKYEEQFLQYKNMRLTIFNKLLDEKKSFIILINNKECEARPYPVLSGAMKILKQNNYSYIELGSFGYDGDTTLEESKLDLSDFDYGSVAIVNKGKLYASISSNIYSIKSEEELINWLSKYINI